MVITGHDIVDFWPATTLYVETRSRVYVLLNAKLFSERLYYSVLSLLAVMEGVVVDPL